MCAQLLFADVDGDVRAAYGPAIERAGTGCSNTDAAAVSAAQARLAAASVRCQQRKAISNNGGKYYGVAKPTSEEMVPIHCAAGEFDGLVTRNHYGCLVLNATRALFIDVDADDAEGGELLASENALPMQSRWRQMLNDLRLVLQCETHEGFRVYRTAAGFRVLATTSEFQPGSSESTCLMCAVGADAAFIELCASQRNFRARLSPKPWRCGTNLPPDSYPRKSPAEQQRFNAWRQGYDLACQHRATCRYLGHIGPSRIHSRIAPIVQLHDRETKALQSLELA